MADSMGRMPAGRPPSNSQRGQKLSFISLLPLVLDEEDTAWERGHVAGNLMESFSATDTDGRETVGAIVLRHGATVRNIHRYFSQLESRQCQVSSSRHGARSSINNIRVPRQTRHGSLDVYEEGALSKVTEGITMVNKLNVVDFEVYKLALLCAQYPKLCVPDPPSATPLPSPPPQPPFSYIHTMRQRSLSLISQTTMCSVTRLSDLDDTASIIPEETLCEWLRQAFGLSRERAAEYESRIYKPLKKKSLQKVLAEELNNQLMLLENNCHPVYGVNSFVTPYAYDQWHNGTRSHIIALIEKVWGFSRHHLKNSASYDASNYHLYYKILLEKLIGYEMSFKRSIDGFESVLRSPLSTASVRLLKEMGLRYGVGETYQQVVHLQYLARHFVNEVWYVRYIQSLLVDILGSLPINQTKMVITKLELEYLMEAAVVIHGQCENSFKRIKKLFPQCPADGVVALTELLDSVLALLGYLKHQKQPVLADVLTAYLKVNFTRSYEEFKLISQQELKMDPFQQTLSLQTVDLQCILSLPCLQLSRLVGYLEKDVNDYKQLYHDVFKNYLDVTQQAVQCFYGDLMEDVLSLCKQHLKNHPSNDLDLDMVSFAYCLNCLDNKWMDYIPPNVQCWRREFLAEALKWLDVLENKCHKFVMESVGTDLFAPLKIAEHVMHASERDHSPVINPETPGLLRSFNSAFDRVKPQQAQVYVPYNKTEIFSGIKTTNVQTDPPGAFSSSSASKQAHQGSQVPSDSESSRPTPRQYFNDALATDTDRESSIQRVLTHSFNRSKSHFDQEAALLTYKERKIHRSVSCPEIGNLSKRNQALESLYNDTAESRLNVTASSCEDLFTSYESNTQEEANSASDIGSLEVTLDEVKRNRRKPSASNIAGTPTNPRKAAETLQTYTLPLQEEKQQELSTTEEAKQNTSAIPEFVGGAKDHKNVSDSKLTGQAGNAADQVNKSQSCCDSGTQVDLRGYGADHVTRERQNTTRSDLGIINEEGTSCDGDDGNEKPGETGAAEEKTLSESNTDGLQSTLCSEPINPIVQDAKEHNPCQTDSNTTKLNKSTGALSSEGKSATEGGHVDLPQNITSANSGSGSLSRSTSSGEKSSASRDTDEGNGTRRKKKSRSRNKNSGSSNDRSQYINEEMLQAIIFHSSTEEVGDQVEGNETDSSSSHDGDVKTAISPYPVLAEVPSRKLSTGTSSTIVRPQDGTPQRKLSGNTPCDNIPARPDSRTLSYRSQNLGSSQSVNTATPRPTPIPHDTMGTPSTVHSGPYSIRPPHGLCPTSGSLVDITCLLQRLTGFARVVSQILYPISKLPGYPDFDTLVKSDSGHGSVAEPREALQKVLFEYASARQQILTRLMKVMSGVVSQYGDNILGMDICGMRDCTARHLVGARLVCDVESSHHQQRIWGCRHIREVKTSCFHYYKKKAKYLGDRFEPISQQMCIRINNMHSLAESVSAILKQTGLRMEEDKLKRLTELTKKWQETSRPGSLENDAFSSSPSIKRYSSPMSVCSTTSQSSFSSNASPTVRFGYKLKKTADGLMNVLSYRINLFCKEALALLMELALPNISMKERLHPLVSFLDINLQKLQNWLYPSLFLEIAQRMWTFITKDLDSLVRGLRNQMEGTKEEAVKLLQAIASLLKFFHCRVPSLDLDSLSKQVEKPSFWLQLYSQSTSRLITLFKQLYTWEQMSASPESRPSMGSGLPSRKCLHAMRQDLHAEKKCFSGIQLIHWLMTHWDQVYRTAHEGWPLPNEHEALEFAERMLASSIITPVNQGEEQNRRKRSSVAAPMCGSPLSPYPPTDGGSLVSTSARSMEKAQFLTSPRIEVAMGAGSDNDGDCSGHDDSEDEGSLLGIGMITASTAATIGSSQGPGLEDSQSIDDLDNIVPLPTAGLTSHQRRHRASTSELIKPTKHHKERANFARESWQDVEVLPRSFSMHEGMHSREWNDSSDSQSTQTTASNFLFLSSNKRFYRFASVIEDLDSANCFEVDDQSSLFTSSQNSRGSPHPNRQASPQERARQAEMGKILDMYLEKEVNSNVILDILRSRRRSDREARRFLYFLCMQDWHEYEYEDGVGCLTFRSPLS